MCALRARKCPSHTAANYIHAEEQKYWEKHCPPSTLHICNWFYRHRAVWWLVSRCPDQCMWEPKALSPLVSGENCYKVGIRFEKISFVHTKRASSFIIPNHVFIYFRTTELTALRVCTTQIKWSYWLNNLKFCYFDWAAHRVFSLFIVVLVIHRTLLLVIQLPWLLTYIQVA